jgi:hypothetical protein
MATDAVFDEQAVARAIIEQMNAADRRSIEQSQAARERSEADAKKMWQQLNEGKIPELPPRATGQKPEPNIEV